MGYIQLDEDLIKELEEVTYEKFHKIGNLIPIDELENTFKDLLHEIDRLKEKNQDLVNVIQNEGHKDKYEYWGEVVYK